VLRSLKDDVIDDLNEVLRDTNAAPEPEKPSFASPIELKTFSAVLRRELDQAAKQLIIAHVAPTSPALRLDR